MFALKREIEALKQNCCYGGELSTIYLSGFEAIERRLLLRKSSLVYEMACVKWKTFSRFVDNSIYMPVGRRVSQLSVGKLLKSERKKKN